MKVPETAWGSCGNDDNCWLGATSQSLDGTGECTTIDQAMADTSSAETSDCACDR